MKNVAGAYMSRAESETDQIHHQQQQPARHHALVRLYLFVNQRHHRQEDSIGSEPACRQEKAGQDARNL